MHSLYKRKDPIPSLYVKSAYGNYQVRLIFEMARNMAPCMLVMEDMETIVYGGTRSYFFNEVDGLENNNGILMIGSTNYLERLDPGITKRPSRFDRKYLFPLPSTEERVQYCNFWRAKVLKLPKAELDYPKKLVNLIAAITYGFSFAYLQEAFVATLLELARQHMVDGVDMSEYIDVVESARSVQAGLESGEFGADLGTTGGNGDDDDDDDDDDDLDKIPFWRVIREQVAILREDISRTSSEQGAGEEDVNIFSAPLKWFSKTFLGSYASGSRDSEFENNQDLRYRSGAESKEESFPVLESVGSTSIRNHAHHANSEVQGLPASTTAFYPHGSAARGDGARNGSGNIGRGVLRTLS
jgi:hypothetical protein